MVTGQTLDIESARLRQLHHDMLRIRRVEERIVALYPEQEMRCPVHLSIGQEAVAVGVCAALSPKDWVMSGHRSHAHYLAKGGDLKAMLAELYGRAAGCAGGRGGSMHLLDVKAGFVAAVPIVASTIPIAVGAAWGSRLRGEPRVVVAFFGEGATEEGVFHEAVNFALLKRLPVLFVCENNLYSVYSPMDVRQPPGREVFELAQGHGMASRQGDGNDVTGVLELTAWAAERARRGEGPAFLEFKTYRWREHCGPNYDNDIGYRTEAEFVEWRERCPLERFERELLGRGVLTSAGVASARAAIDAEIDAAVDFAKSSPYPEPSALGRFTYADSRAR